MKVAILTDTHFGARSDSKLFLDSFTKFYTNQFFPYLNKNNIETVIHLGDLFDKRKYIHFNTLRETRQHFLEPLSKFNTHIITGNHDCFHKNTNDLNSIQELCTHYNFNIHTGPSEIELDGAGILLIPWINQENHEDSIRSINTTKYQICMGHFEIQGFEMFLGTVCHDGLQASLFDRFDVTLSCHFHTKSSIGNIHYLGSPYQWTWNDYGEEKGFHIFDTKTRKLTFIPNKNNMFHKITYTNDLDTNSIDPEIYRNSFVKIQVSQKSNPYHFDMFRDKIDNACHDLKIVDRTNVLNISEMDTFDGDNDTLSFLKKTISDQDLTIDKNKLESLFTELYTTAITNEAP